MCSFVIKDLFFKYFVFKMKFVVGKAAVYITFYLCLDYLQVFFRQNSIRNHKSKRCLFVLGSATEKFEGLLSSSDWITISFKTNFYGYSIEKLRQ